MKIFKEVTVFTVVVLAVTLLSFSQKKEEKLKEVSVETSSETQVAYFASGCFWCVEAIFESVNGVEEAVSGYAGGHTKNPTYKTIGTGRTGHAESVAVYYNPKKVSFQTLVTVFFGSHDPTTKNGQHPDYGSQYRSIAFYKTEEEKQLIENTIERLNKDVYQGKIVTEVKKMEKFYPAEEYHQNYERLHPENPYVQKVSIPRLNRFKRKFPELLKKEKH
ncbi:peptide-methionine (S)-S-oxide reductase MsrA [Tenacibaculum sp. Mcav3-52]|uniref:peptide-methionine (S)-S-oxide reductase MsrA n=1 Tax=Tenacibaculum TaxID=104267 RepID=UPI001EF16F98|nr:peptide-methionine (S)-S-oxide reductase MsrA [Tenacibaculum sp. Mcav3-52]MCG7502524.1 peptide-methionine (S)-S-oxide reductase MsrA [Tenacibaculum sp. Mcav3-52]BFF41203.1 peptide-methionine (S)-S-oxide reductase MsrA [Tenacibaculum mesophilum]